MQVLLILGAFVGALVGFFTATLLVCAARSDQEDAVGPVAARERLARCDTEDRDTGVPATV